MKCILCKQLDLQSNDKMARMGYGKCKMDKDAWRYVSFGFVRTCKDFDQVSDVVGKKRTDWADGILKSKGIKK